MGQQGNSCAQAARQRTCRPRRPGARLVARARVMGSVWGVVRRPWPGAVQGRWGAHARLLVAHPHPHPHARRGWPSHGPPSWAMPGTPHGHWPLGPRPLRVWHRLGGRPSKWVGPRHPPRVARHARRGHARRRVALHGPPLLPFRRAKGWGSPLHVRGRGTRAQGALPGIPPRAGHEAVARRPHGTWGTPCSPGRQLVWRRAEAAGGSDLDGDGWTARAVPGRRRGGRGRGDDFLTRYAASPQHGLY